MPTGIDQSWGYTDPATAARAGVQVVSMYLSHDSSKNITPAKVRAYHKAGIASLLNWESQAGAPVLGAAQGKADAAEAVRQAKALIKAVGYAPANRLTIYFSCDRDVSAAQIKGSVAAYYKAAAAVCHAAGFGVGAYGEAALVKYLSANAITDGEWQTYAWSGGALDPVTDFYQYNNGQKIGGASVDYDRVIHSAQLGAWWPPTHAMNIATEDEGDPLANLTPAQLDQIAAAVWAHRIKDDVTKVNYQAGTYVVAARQHAITIESLLATLAKKVDGVTQILGTAKTGVLARVASLQTTADSVKTTVSTLSPTGAATVDVQKIIDGVSAKLPDAVAAKVKALNWKAS